MEGDAMYLKAFHQQTMPDGTRAISFRATIRAEMSHTPLQAKMVCLFLTLTLYHSGLETAKGTTIAAHSTSVKVKLQRVNSPALMRTLPLTIAKNTDKFEKKHHSPKRAVSGVRTKLE
ncbi:hypothetical protein P5673_028207 [Acropora cervicornis]|uniref:Uncharacterized protein n=1 Tax=Acropora cervicornis TaxID=6130 RepID=A0AAD9PY22_ACRCE|nr:hypothetical protein P5673_028207 [Acropora cervicornis]